MNKTNRKRTGQRRLDRLRCSVNLREIANTFRRMGDDANHVRLENLNDATIREPWAAAAEAYYNCMRHVQVLLPNTELSGGEKATDQKS